MSGFPYLGSVARKTSFRLLQNLNSALLSHIMNVQNQKTPSLLTLWVSPRCPLFKRLHCRMQFVHPVLQRSESFDINWWKVNRLWLTAPHGFRVDKTEKTGWWEQCKLNRMEPRGRIRHWVELAANIVPKYFKGHVRNSGNAWWLSDVSVLSIFPPSFGVHCHN